MSKNKKASPSQLAMSEVLAKETEVTTESVDLGQKTEVSVLKTESKPKPTARKRGKRYLAAAKLMAAKGPLGPREATEAIQESVFSSFEESLELHVNLLEENVRGEVELPYSTGKKLSVVEADESVIEKLEKGIVDFDVLVASPAIMPKLTKFAKILGPKGLMPNPKAGTLGVNTKEMIKKFSGNTVRFKTEPKSPIIHVTVGKTKADKDHLVANIEAYLAGIGRKKIKNAFLASTMSPSVQLVI